MHTVQNGVFYVVEVGPITFSKIGVSSCYPNLHHGLQITRTRELIGIPFITFAS